MATNVAASSSPFARYLAYPVPSPDGPPTHFLKGPRDLLLVFGAFCVLVVMREIAMRAVFAPLGRRFIVEEGAPAKQRSTKGARRLTPKEVRRRQKKAIRLAEQGWSMLYYTVYWSFGLVRSFPLEFLLPCRSRARETGRVSKKSAVAHCN